jgi:hypothetical protein
LLEYSKEKDFISVDVLLQNRKKKKSMSFLMLEVFKVYTKGNVRDRIYSLCDQLDSTWLINLIFCGCYLEEMCVILIP